MKFLEKLILKPKIFQRVIGLSVEQLILLSEQVYPLWQKQESKRLSRKNRKRAMGAGRQYTFKTIKEKVAVVLFYYKSYPTQELLGMILDTDQSTISRLFHRIIPLIEEAADPEMKTFLSNVKAIMHKEHIKTLDQLFLKFPELKDVSTDATEQSCYRSTDYEQQKEYYSGKSKKHAIKTQILVSYNGKLLDISKSYPGKVHDKKIMDQERTIEKLPEIVPQRFDSGYQGIINEYPQHYLILQRKKPKGKPLANIDKELNWANSKRRIIAEHIISRLKKFKILSNVFRNKLFNYNVIFRGVAAILNFRLSMAAKVI